MYPIKASVNNRPNEIVRAMQGQLKYMSYYVDVDGIYGPQTAKAVKRFCDTPQRRVPYGSDGQGLPLLSYEIVRAVRERYEKQPVMYAALPPKTFIRSAELSNSLSKESFLKDNTIKDFLGNCLDLVSAVIEEFQTKELRDALKTKNPRIVIKEFQIKINPKIEEIYKTYDKLRRNLKRSSVPHSTKVGLKNQLNRQVNDVTPITDCFHRVLKRIHHDKKIEVLLKSKNGKVISKSLGPIGILMTYGEVLGDLFFLIFAYFLGAPIDQQWKSEFLEHLTSLADALITVMVAELIALGLVALGWIGGASALVIAVIAIILGIIIKIFCPDFSPTKLISQALAWAAVNFVISPNEDTQRTMNHLLYST